MPRFNKTAHLFIATALCGALLLPVAAQAHGKRNDATKVTDATILPAKKVVHGTKKSGKKAFHFGKKTSKSAERRVSHVGKQIIR